MTTNDDLDGGAEMGFFAYLATNAEILASGGISFDYQITPFDAAQYDFSSNPADIIRIVLEVIFLLMLLRLLLIEGQELVERFLTRRAAGYGVAGSLMGYFGDTGNMLDLANYIVQTLAVTTWIRFVLKCRVFRQSFHFRFPVYEVRLTR